MKIALVSAYDYAYTGGVNVHISRLEENFTRMGHEVKIIAPSSKPLESRVNDDVMVFGRPVAIHASGSVVRVPLSPRLLFSRRLRKMLQQENFDVVHIHEPLLPVLATSILHHTSNELVVGTFHAFRNRSWGYPFWKPIILNRWFNKLDGRIAVSKAAMEFVSRYFPGDYKIIPNGIDLPHFAADCNPFEEFCDEKLNILFVGRMEKRKGFKYLLSAYEIVKQKFPMCRLIVVGPQDRSWRKYQSMAAKRNLKDIVFTGFVSYDDLPRYYRSADVFCSPATGKESFGLVLLEAMACGKPTVASDIAGYAGVISDGIDGLLVKPQDVEALAEALLKLLHDEPLRKQMGAKGEIKARDFAWETIAQRVMEYYQDLLHSRRHVVSEEIACAQQGSTRLGSACK